MTTESELLAAIAASPDDATRLVYADWLLARDDETSRKRGELIMLDYKERTTDGGIASPDQMGQLLRLAAELGFPHLPDPDAELVGFEQLGRDNAHWRFACNGTRYELRRDRELLALASTAVVENRTLAITGRWTDAQTNAILTIVLRVIQNGADFHMLRFPDPQQLSVGNLCGIKRDLHRLGVSCRAGAHGFVLCGRSIASGISGDYFPHTFDVFIDTLDAPEATSGEHGRLQGTGLFGIVRGRRRDHDGRFSSTRSQLPCNSNHSQQCRQD